MTARIRALLILAALPAMVLPAKNALGVFADRNKSDLQYYYSSALNPGNDKTKPYHPDTNRVDSTWIFTCGFDKLNQSFGPDLIQFYQARDNETAIVPIMISFGVVGPTSIEWEDAAGTNLRNMDLDWVGDAKPASDKSTKFADLDGPHNRIGDINYRTIGLGIEDLLLEQPAGTGYIAMDMTSGDSIKAGSIKKTTTSGANEILANVANGTASVLGVPSCAEAVIGLGPGTLQYSGDGRTSNRAVNLTGDETIDALGIGLLDLSGSTVNNGWNLALTSDDNGDLNYDAITIGGVNVIINEIDIWSPSAASTYDSDTLVTARTFADSGNIGSTMGAGWTPFGIGIIEQLLEAGGGTFVPGSVIGTISTQDTAWSAGGSFDFKTHKVRGGVNAGPELNLLNTSDNQDANPPPGSYKIEIDTLLAGTDTLDNSEGFDFAGDYIWDFVHYSTMIGVFAPGDFVLNTRDFNNSFIGTFANFQEEDPLNNLFSGFIPGPFTFILTGIILLCLLIWRRRYQMEAKSWNL